MKVFLHLYIFYIILLEASGISVSAFNQISYSNVSVNISSGKVGAFVVLSVKSSTECASICSMLACSMFRYRRRQCGLHNDTWVQGGYMKEEWLYYRNRDAIINTTTTPSHTATTTTTRPTQYEKTCDHAATFFEDFCYSFVGKKQKNRHAVAQCRKDDLGYLVEVKNEQTQSFMKSFLQNRASACVWIGGKRKRGKWKWSHSGARITYSSWYPNEPDDRLGIFSTENCIEATPTGNFYWNDLSCMSNCHTICQTRWNGQQQKVYDLTDCGAHGGKGYGQSCYVYRSDKLKWNEAKESCIRLNMHLVEISEEDENSFVRFYIMTLKISRDTSIWTGLNDIHHEGHWVWATSGTKANFTYWAPGNPSGVKRRILNHLEEDCVEINVHGNYKWNDQSCGKPFTYICESRCGCSPTYRFTKPPDQLLDRICPYC